MQILIKYSRHGKYQLSHGPPFQPWYFSLQLIGALKNDALAEAALLKEQLMEELDSPRA